MLKMLKSLELKMLKSLELMKSFAHGEVFGHGVGFGPSSRNRRDVESKPKWLRKEFTRLFVNKFWNKYNFYYFLRGFVQSKVYKSYRQHNALIPSVRLPTFNKV